jgi:V/A-type H+-transporting ATPase subunit D
MAKKKIKLTRTELKAQRDALARYERYLPTLKLKEQQIQSSIVKTHQALRQVQAQVDAAQHRMAVYQGLFNDVAGINVRQLAQPEQISTVTHSIAGIKVPQFQGVRFAQVDYSLFGTAAWVDRALSDLRDINRLQTERDTIKTCLELLQTELKKVMQRVNLFEKIKIPETQDIIRRIRIAVGDQMTAAVARAKIAKSKLEQKEHQRTQEAMAV